MYTGSLLLTRDEVRAIDRAAVDELGLTGPLLMENAARGVCDIVLQSGFPAGQVLILCGPGNNGGDGFALARQLAAWDVSSIVYLTTAGRELTPDCQFNRDVWRASDGAIYDGDDVPTARAALERLCRDDLIVDCLLGTGIRGAARTPFRELIAAANASAAAILAVDVPSGMDCETGTAAGECIAAARTVTFVARKSGFDNADAKRSLGDVEVAHIGLPHSWVRNWILRYREASASESADARRSSS